MKQFKKLSALILSLVLLLAAIPTVSLSVAAAVDPAQLDVRVDFAANNHAVNALYALEGIERVADIGLTAVKGYNYIDAKVLPGSTVAATFTIPEGEAAPKFQVAPTANGIWVDITATEAVDGTTRTYTIDSVGAANSFVRIVLPVLSETYAMTTLAFNYADTTLDFTALSTAMVAYDMSTVDGVYDYTGSGYWYHVGQKRLDILNNGDLIFKVAAGSPFEAYATRVVANASFSVSADGIHWTPKNTYAYECTGTGGYDTYHWYMSSVGENNQFVKLSVTGAEATSTDAWKEYIGLYSVAYQKSTAVLPVTEEREATDNALVPPSNAVDVSTLDVNLTFSGTTFNPLPYIAGGVGMQRGTAYQEEGRLIFSSKDAYAIFKTEPNSPFVVWVQHWTNEAAAPTAVISVSPTGLDGSWTVIEPAQEVKTTAEIKRTWKYVIPAIGGKNQYVKVQIPDSTSTLDSIAAVAFNQPTIDRELSMAEIPERYPTSSLSGFPDLYSYSLADSTKTNHFYLEPKKPRFTIGHDCELVFKTAYGSTFVVDGGTTSTDGTHCTVTFYASPTAEDGTWVSVPHIKGTSKYTVTSIGAENQYVKMVVTGATGAFVRDFRITKFSWIKNEPTFNDVTVQDVTLETEYTATGIEATVAYDAEKLEYKGFYNAAGEATVTDNGNGTLSVAVTATEAVKGDWITLVLLPKAEVLGSATVEITDLTATGGEAANLTAGKTSLWFDTATEGNAIVEFDNGTSATVYEDAIGAELAMPAAPERDGYVFAGWYTENGVPFTAVTYPEGGARVVAKWAGEETLSLGVQLTNGTTAESEKTNLRLVSTVDSLQYAEAGFVIKIADGAEQARTITTVYNRIKGASETYVPWDAFSTDSRYFFAFNIRNIPNSAFGTDITVTPFWVTYDGATVYGETEVMTVNGLL